MIGFQRGTHANWQVVTNDGSGAPTLTDMGASFAVAIGGVLTLFIAAVPNATSVWVRAVSRTLKGGGAAGIATVGAAGVEVAQDVLAETQSAILPLVPYLDTLRWVFIAVALIGIAVAIHARIDDWKRGQR